MRTRVIVCGGRDFSDKELCFENLDRILADYDDVAIVSGHARSFRQATTLRKGSARNS